MRTDAEPVSEGLSPRARLRRALAMLLRSLLVSTSIVVGYFVLPLTSPLAVDTLLELTLGLSAIATLMTWQVLGILRSPQPGVNAIAAIMVSLPLFLTVFATTYYLMAHDDPSSFSEPLTRLDAIYYTITMFATVGFGDITAASQVARAVATAQMVVGLVFVGLIARVVVGAVEEARSRGRQSSDRPG